MAELSTESGIGWIPSSTGCSPRASAKEPSASSGAPDQHHTTAHIFCRWSSSGNGGPGGTVRNAKNPFSSSGAFEMNSLYHERISAERSSGHSVGPATTVESGLRRNAKRVTTPKLAPPPRKRPEEVRMLLVVRGDEAAIRKDDVRLHEIVDRKPELAGHVTDTAAERET